MRPSLLKIKNKLQAYPATAATLAGLLTLLAALISEYGFGYRPCDMCWWQRYPYMVAPVALLLFHFFGQREGRLSLFVLAAIFWTNALMAAFHVGVEQRWWDGITSCAANDFSGSVEDMLAQIKNTALVRCDEIQFQLFGISMAGYNFIIAFGLGLFCLIIGLRRQT